MKLQLVTQRFSLLTFMAACGFVAFTYATSGQTKQTALIAGKVVDENGGALENVTVHSSEY